jgi:hypothetical protein
MTPGRCAELLHAYSRLLAAHAALLEAQAGGLLDAAAPADAAVPAETGCPHPEDDRLDASTLRAPQRFYCQQCHAFVVPQPDVLAS